MTSELAKQLQLLMGIPPQELHTILSFFRPLSLARDMGYWLQQLKQACEQRSTQEADARQSG